MWQWKRMAAAIPLLGQLLARLVVAFAIGSLYSSFGYRQEDVSSEFSLSTDENTLESNATWSITTANGMCQSTNQAHSPFPGVPVTYVSWKGYASKMRIWCSYNAGTTSIKWKTSSSSSLGGTWRNGGQAAVPKSYSNHPRAYFGFCIKGSNMQAVAIASTSGHSHCLHCGTRADETNARCNR